MCQKKAKRNAKRNLGRGEGSVPVLACILWKQREISPANQQRVQETEDITVREKELKIVLKRRDNEHLLPQKNTRRLSNERIVILSTCSMSDDQLHSLYSTDQSASNYARLIFLDRVLNLSAFNQNEATWYVCTAQ